MALTGTEHYDGGFVRDGDGRLVTKDVGGASQGPAPTAYAFPVLQTLNGDTATKVFTAPVAGKYALSFGIRTAMASVYGMARAYWSTLTTTGTRVSGLVGTPLAVAGDSVNDMDFGGSITEVFDLAAGQTVTFRGHGDVTSGGSPSQHSFYFSVLAQYLGPTLGSDIA